MSKQAPYSEVKVTMEKFVEDAEYCKVRGVPGSGGSDGQMMRGGGYLVGNFWGQLGLMALLTFLFWLCLFVIAGSFIPISHDTYRQEALVKALCPQGFEKKPEQPPAQQKQQQQSLPEPVPLPVPVVQQSGFVFAAIFTVFGDNATQGLPNLFNYDDTDASSSDDVVVDLEFPDLNPLTQVQNGAGGSADGDDETFQLFSDQATAINEIMRTFDEAAALTAQGRKYFVGPADIKLNWFESTQACLLQKMQLVSIETEEESQEIERLIAENLDSSNDADDFWISGTNLWTWNPNKFYWASTGEPMNYTNWHENNPSSMLGIAGQNCVELTKTLDTRTRGKYMWNDYGCHVKSRFICEAL